MSTVVIAQKNRLRILNIEKSPKKGHTDRNRKYTKIQSKVKWDWFEDHGIINWNVSTQMQITSGKILIHFRYNSIDKETIGWENENGWVNF